MKGDVKLRDRITTEFIAKTAMLLAIALVFQIGLKGIGQPLVGPLVNFVLIMSVYLVGTLSGLIVGFLTPLIAFFFGIIPFLPIVPFIMIGNGLYVFFFKFFKDRLNSSKEIISIIISSIIKYLFLAISVRYIVVLFVQIPPKVVAAFSIPQLYTALIGGILAFIVKTFLPEDMISNS